MNHSEARQTNYSKNTKQQQKKNKSKLRKKKVQTETRKKPSSLYSKFKGPLTNFCHLRFATPGKTRVSDAINRELIISIPLYCTGKLWFFFNLKMLYLK